MINNQLENCPFCRIARRAQKSIPEYDMPIIETADFFVIPALGQFTEGYVLICPWRHFPNLGVMDSGLLDQFFELKERVRILLYEEYRCKPVFFEHGAVSQAKRGGSCIDHAHLHAIPIALTSPPSRIVKELAGKRIEGFDAVAESALSRKPYFFLECAGGEMYLYDTPELPCQYGRRVVSQLLGIPEQWDWALYAYRDRMLTTARSLIARTERNVRNSPILCPAD